MNLSIRSIPLSEYRVVYAHPVLDDHRPESATGLSIREDVGQYLLGTPEETALEFDRLSAEVLRDAIADRTGIVLPVVSDTAAEPAPYEILVGACNRPETDASVFGGAAEPYRLYVAGTKPLLFGGSYAATRAAVERFREFLNGLPEADFDLSRMGDRSGKANLLKVACIGDSITRGSQAFPDGEPYCTNYLTHTGSASPSIAWGSAREYYFRHMLSYPANLGRMFWQSAVFYNYGRGCATACEYEGQDPNAKPRFASTPFWEQCKENVTINPYDLVFIMLGTNDLSFVKNKTPQRRSYADEMRVFMDAILCHSPQAKFVVMNVPHRCGEQPGGTPSTLRPVQEDAVRQLAHEGYAIWVYDMNAYNELTMQSAAGVEEILSACADPDAARAWAAGETPETVARCAYYDLPGGDGTHPTYRGYRVIAEGMAAVVRYFAGTGSLPEPFLSRPV